jgi:hypothetical protein
VEEYLSRLKKIVAQGLLYINAPGVENSIIKENPENPCKIQF